MAVAEAQAGANFNWSSMQNQFPSARETAKRQQVVTISDRAAQILTIEWQSVPKQKQKQKQHRKKEKRKKKI